MQDRYQISTSVFIIDDNAISYNLFSFHTANLISKIVLTDYHSDFDFLGRIVTIFNNFMFTAWSFCSELCAIEKLSSNARLFNC